MNLSFWQIRHVKNSSYFQDVKQTEDISSIHGLSLLPPGASWQPPKFPYRYLRATGNLKHSDNPSSDDNQTTFTAIADEGYHVRCNPYQRRHHCFYCRRRDPPPGFHPCRRRFLRCSCPAPPSRRPSCRHPHGLCHFLARGRRLRRNRRSSRCLWCPRPEEAHQRPTQAGQLVHGCPLPACPLRGRPCHPQQPRGGDALHRRHDPVQRQHLRAGARHGAVQVDGPRYAAGRRVLHPWLAVAALHPGCHPSPLNDVIAICPE